MKTSPMMSPGTELDRLVRERGNELLKAHQRVRQAVRKTRVKYDIQPQLPPDVLGLYVYLPVLEPN